MIYVDQPIGTGFSYGTDSVTSTITAAPYVWKLLQAFYAQFPNYENHNFGLFTESYGGHYGPEFASYLWVWPNYCILQIQLKDVPVSRKMQAFPRVLFLA